MFFDMDLMIRAAAAREIEQTKALETEKAEH